MHVCMSYYLNKFQYINMDYAHSRRMCYAFNSSYTSTIIIVTWYGICQFTIRYESWLFISTLIFTMLHYLYALTLPIVIIICLSVWLITLLRNEEQQLSRPTKCKQDDAFFILYCFTTVNINNNETNTLVSLLSDF